MNLQNSDGWISKALHGTDQLVWCIRLLCEKGVESNHSLIARTLDAIEKRGEDFDRGSLFKVGKILDEYGLGGSQLIRAVVFAYAEAEDHPFVIEQIPKALENDWRTTRRRMFDLTFKSLLILHYSTHLK